MSKTIAGHRYHAYIKGQLTGRYRISMYGKIVVEVAHRSAFYPLNPFTQLSWIADDDLIIYEEFVCPGGDNK